MFTVPYKDKNRLDQNISNSKANKSTITTTGPHSEKENLIGLQNNLPWSDRSVLSN